MTWQDLVPTDWRGYLEIFALWAVIYYAWLSIRGTRGARVLVGLGVLVLSMATMAGFFELPVLGWIIRNVMPVLIFAVIVIFQPEVRRGLAALGSNRWFSTATGTPETIELITEATFDLSNRQLGALLAIEREQNLDSIAENGQEIDCDVFAGTRRLDLFSQDPAARWRAGHPEQPDRRRGLHLPRQPARGSRSHAWDAASRSAWAVRGIGCHRHRGQRRDGDRFDLSSRQRGTKL